MTKCKKGAVVLAKILFTDGSETKKRPVVIVSGSHYNAKREEVIVAAITSNTIRRIFGDIKIEKWKEAGLLFPSVVTGILLSIKKSLIDKQLGEMSDEDLGKVDDNLQRCLGI